MLQIDQLGWPNVRLVNPGPRLQSSGLFDSQLTAISYTNQILYHVNLELDTRCTVCILVRSLTLNSVTSQSLFRCQSCNLVICDVNFYNFSNILAYNGHTVSNRFVLFPMGFLVVYFVFDPFCINLN